MECTVLTKIIKDIKIQQMSSHRVVHPDVLEIMVYNSNFVNNIVLICKYFIYTMEF